MHLGVGPPHPRQRQCLRVLPRRRRGEQHVRRGQYDLLALHVRGWHVHDQEPEADDESRPRALLAQRDTVRALDDARRGRV
eukprot:scaffold74513_cov75-Phaeocystis_antarctica.AAC.1